MNNIDLTNLSPEVIKLVPYAAARMYSVVPIRGATMANTEPSLKNPRCGKEIVLALDESLSTADIVHHLDELTFVLGASVSFALVESAALKAALAKYYPALTTPVDLTDLPAATIAMVPGHVARRYAIVPVGETSTGLTVAISDESDVESLDGLRYVLKKEIGHIVVHPAEIHAALAKYYPSEEMISGLSELTERQERVSCVPSLVDLNKLQEFWDQTVPSVVKALQTDRFEIQVGVNENWDTYASTRSEQAANEIAALLTGKGQTARIVRYVTAYELGKVQESKISTSTDNGESTVAGTLRALDHILEHVPDGQGPMGPK